MSECYCFSAPVKGCPTHDNEHGPFPDLGSGPTAAERILDLPEVAGTYYWAEPKKDSKGLPVPWSGIYGSSIGAEITPVVKALKESFDQCREDEARGILDLPREEE